MSKENNIFTLRFFGNDVTPESFSLKEFGQLVISFNDGIRELIDVRFPTVNAADIRISVAAIENKSESISFQSSGESEISEALHELGKSITNRTYTDLPFKTYGAVKLIHGIAKRKGCFSELVERNNRLFVVAPNEEFVEQQKVLVKSNMVLYGDLNKIGGNKTKAWVELYDGSKVTFSINNEQFIKLQGRIKQPIAINGEATWNVITKKVVSFKLKEIMDYTSGAVSNGFDEIRKISNGWDDINTDAALIDYLNGDA